MLNSYRQGNLNHPHCEFVLTSEHLLLPVFFSHSQVVKYHSDLAGHLVHSIRLRLKDHDIHDSWETLRCTMRGHIRVTTTMRTKQDETIHIRKAARPEAWQQTIYKTLRLNQNPGGTMKTIVPD